MDSIYIVGDGSFTICSLVIMYIFLYLKIENIKCTKELKNYCLDKLPSQSNDKLVCLACVYSEFKSLGDTKELPCDTKELENSPA